MIKIDDIWQKVIVLEPDDPPLKLKVPNQKEIERIKRRLSTYKHRELEKDEVLREALGEFRLIYDSNRLDNGWILLISIANDPSTISLQAEWA